MSRIVSEISPKEINELKDFGINLRILEKLDASQSRDLYVAVSAIWKLIKKAEKDDMEKWTALISIRTKIEQESGKMF